MSTGGVTPARNNNSTGQQQPTSAPTKTNNISAKIECSYQIQLPRSRLSVFAPSVIGLGTRRQSFSPSTRLATTNSLISAASPASLLNNIGENHPKCLDSSVLKNGSIISSLGTYANSVRDTVEKTIASQQDYIASKLVEIADSLAVLSSLTQRIGDLETKVDSLEALLVTEN